MPFMVIYSTSDGASCHQQADAIDEAALFVERLRNKEGIDQIRIYRMEEISFAFRPYYKVELGLPEKQAAGTPPATVTAIRPAAGQPAHLEPAEVAVEASPSVDADPSPDGTGVEGDCAIGRRGLFGR